MNFKLPTLLAAVTAAAFVGQSAMAIDTASVGASAPAVDGDDIANLSAATGSLSSWGDRPVQGQTFTSPAGGGDLNSITVQIFESAENAPINGWKDWQLRFGTMTFNADPEVSDVINVDAIAVTRYEPDADADSYFTFTFNTPVALLPSTVYGFDLGVEGSQAGWQAGIPGIRSTGDEYAGGQRFQGAKTNQIDNITGLTNNISLTGGDLVFHLDIGAGTPVIPGDTDGDGDIDDSDLGTSFSNYTGPVGAIGGKTAADGDTDGDGDVDDSDLGTSFSGYTGPLAAAVPEPTSLALLGLGGLLIARRRRA